MKMGFSFSWNRVGLDKSRTRANEGTSGVIRSALAVAALWLVALSPVARAQDVLSPSPSDISAVSDPLDALAVIREHLGDNSICLRPGQGGGGGAPSRAVATGVSLVIECASQSGGTRQHVYAEFPNIVFRVYHDPLVVICPSQQQTNRCNPYRELTNIFHFRADEAYARRFTGGWIALGRTRAVRDPAVDAEFRQAVDAAAPPSAVQREELRRIQVQVESAMRANRNVDAARLYRDALRTSPGWADGHYNLGLLFGDLELYPEAITEMRRYLYLTPNAEDARAVQDKIYEWEATMAETSQ